MIFVTTLKSNPSHRALLFVNCNGIHCGANKLSLRTQPCWAVYTHFYRVSAQPEDREDRKQGKLHWNRVAQPFLLSARTAQACSYCISLSAFYFLSNKRSSSSDKLRTIGNSLFPLEECFLPLGATLHWVLLTQPWLRQVILVFNLSSALSAQESLQTQKAGSKALGQLLTPLPVVRNLLEKEPATLWVSRDAVPCKTQFSRGDPVKPREATWCWQC